MKHCDPKDPHVGAEPNREAEGGGAAHDDRPKIWRCNPKDEEEHVRGMLPAVPYAQTRAYVSDEELFPDGRVLPAYPFTRLDQIDVHVRLAESDGLAETLDALRSGAGETSPVALSGPMALLSSLIDPTRLFKMVHDPAFDDTLLAFADAIADYMVAAIECGARVISFADIEGCVEIVGLRFFERHTGPALIRCLKRIDPYLDDALVHLCGKSSASLTGTGHAELHPVLAAGTAASAGTGTRSNYVDALFACAQRKDCRLIGNNCVHTSSFEPGQQLYRLELVSCKWERF